MRRCILPIIAILATSALAACSDVATAPAVKPEPKVYPSQKAAMDDVCISGYIGPSGEYICEEWGEGGDL